MSAFTSLLRAHPSSPVPPAAGAGPVLLASSAGGHLTELTVLARRWGLAPDRQHWVVPRTPQSESMLDGLDVTWASPVSSRDLRGAVRNLGSADSLHRRLHPALVLSAGAAQAVPHLLAAAMHRSPVVYVESVARVVGPSVTGRIAARLPGSRLYTQADTGWGARWQHTDDVFSCFAAVTVARRATLDSAVVTLGTERFDFGRAVREVLGVLPSGTDVTWQVGSTTFEGPRGQLQRWLPASELAEAISCASTVISHGGAGSVLTALAAGHVPVVLPRLAAHGEHVDDHQVAMCANLADRGLVVLVEPGQELGRQHLEQAASLRAVPSREAAPATMVSALGLAG